MERATIMLKACFGFKKDKPSTPTQEVSIFQKMEIERVTNMFKSCFGFKKDNPSTPTQKVKKETRENTMISNAGGGQSEEARERRRDTAHITTTTAEQSEHAIEVAAAEAATAGTNLSRIIPLETSAAIKIQSVFRGHLVMNFTEVMFSFAYISRLDLLCYLK